jgi:Fic family protein
MIYRNPELKKIDFAVLGLLKAQRDRLRVTTQSSNPTRWMGSLRRNTFARQIRASNSIEGIHASIENVVAAIEHESPVDIEMHEWLSIKGYRDAMTYIMQAAKDPYFEFSKQFLKSLQFMIVGHDMTKNPGQWRPGSIFIVDQGTGQTVYEGPDGSMVNELVQELVHSLSAHNAVPVMVRAAMAHLNLTMIHPFKDGNGRVSRALQTLVLAREGILDSVYCSIEEWLGKVTPEYYAVLASVGEGKWQPDRDPLPWVRFCLKAHFHQAATLLRRNEEYSKLYAGIEKIIKREYLDERSTISLFDAAHGLSITNSWYRRDAEVSEVVASRDLKRLCDVGLLVPSGEKRGRTYAAANELKELRKSVRQDQPYLDPYEIVGDQSRQDYYFSEWNPPEPTLPGLLPA